MNRTTGITQLACGAAILALSCGSAQAGEKLRKEAGVGMLSGAATGALVGGPIGAGVGLMFGAILGDSIGMSRASEQRARKLEEELIDTRLALARASERSGGDEMLDALAERLHADVMFRTGSAELDVQVAGKLEELGRLLAAHPQLEVELHGFADPRGKDEENLELSLRRADAVRETLIKGGAAPEKIRLSAHGEDLTTAPKDDFEAYAWERRVSLAIRPNGTGKVAQAR